MRLLSRRRLALDAVLFLFLLGLGLALTRPGGSPQRKRPAADARLLPAPAPKAHAARKGYSLYRRAPGPAQGPGLD